MEVQEGRIFKSRKKIPLDLSKVSEQPSDTLRCGETYSISQEGYLIFRLSSKKSCHYSFLGSRTDNCTAAIFCDGVMTIAKSINGTCDTEVFAVTDGTEGFMSGCGTFHFGNAPRRPRKGKDLYVYYRGMCVKSKCIAFCAEDWKNRGNLKPVRPVALNKKYKGLETDKSCVCGMKGESEGRVVGGTTALKFEFPWMVALVFKGSGYERSPFCGGALVNNLYVISAAHCFVESGVQPDQFELVFHAHVMDKRSDDGQVPSDDDSNFKDIPGWADPRETDESEHSIRLEAESVLVHPLFDRLYDFDIAIIKLKKKLEFTSPELLPICLPTIEETFDYADGENLIVTGWGKTRENARAGARVLQKLNVPYLSLRNCSKYTLARSRHLCAGYLEGEKDACAGDSGGPLIHSTTPKGDQYMLSGVVSAGKGCARKESLGLYTNIYELSQWIYYHMDGAVWCAR
ncbi:unnamed protein product [Orchesella dallaii]|uniref:Peptidase S1 domain-containing protein n=1 Tax=Orchesella dallaii TaxID=48710 RepID=A0ABP1QHZ0_9HEXA